jgi:hypothetical protein
MAVLGFLAIEFGVDIVVLLDVGVELNDTTRALMLSWPKTQRSERGG